ncbi:hypothetical protein GCM10011512_01300 [Tersicoccus solisilvae]|uniref:DUF456 domain-containing protein n=1 Tax=Tersicoccus solisilvae TaxID=1882339 RepID=A0ABQ1NJ54_9MICC|nr:DUF456 domain-containing protein [Tersicoccus solisilvae]GGC78463.1 hypothetical protein GCM10011512_01300 [Tersicoccus solisilvae]
MTPVLLPADLAAAAPPMTSGQVVVTVIAALALLVGLLGIVVPVLPGSVLIVVGLLVWAIGMGSTTGWVVFAVGTVLAAAGMSAGWVLTGRRLKARQIPNRSIVIGLVAAVVGAFLIPVVGLLVGFVAGLLLSELARQRDLRAALSTSWTAVKATGLGILVEFGCGCLAVSTFAIGVWVQIASR